MKFNKENNYALILDSLLKELDQHDTFPDFRTTSNKYSLLEPSICSSTKKKPLIMYDIEIDQEITEVIYNKWKDHSIKCHHLYLVVPKSLIKVTEQAISDILNSSIITYEFIESENNRSVKFDFNE